MGKVIKEVRNTIAGHQILIFDDESSFTLARGEHEEMKLKVGEENPPVILQEAKLGPGAAGAASQEASEEKS